MSSHQQPLPLVTIVVNCYNHSRFVVEALESVKAQAYPNLRLVVLDDCSKDDSAEIIRQWLDRHYPDAVFVEHKTNAGICRSLNEALSHAQGKYVRLLASDDRMVPGMLLRQVEAMEADSEEVGVLYSDAFQMDESGELLPKNFIETYRPLAQMPEGWIFDTLVEGNFIPGMTALIRRRCFDVVGNADEGLVFEDWDWWLRVSRQFRFKYFPEPTACYRIVSTSMTGRWGARIMESEQRMFVKYLRWGWLAGERKKDAILWEYLGAFRAYRDGRPDRVVEAARSFRHRICIKHALLLLSVAMGLPFNRFEQLMTFLRHVRGRAKTPIANDEIRREPR